MIVIEWNEYIFTKRFDFCDLCVVVLVLSLDHEALLKIEAILKGIIFLREIEMPQKKLVPNSS